MGLKAYGSPKHYLCLCGEMICSPCMTTYQQLDKCFSRSFSHFFWLWAFFGFFQPFLSGFFQLTALFSFSKLLTPKIFDVVDCML
jgi:hypothetical protein